MPPKKRTTDPGRLERVIAQARREQAARGQGYREQALKIYPWICGRCARAFTHANLQLLEVHHRDGNHDNNPADGSRELLYACHEAEHRKYPDNAGRDGDQPGVRAAATYQPLENSVSC
jgi:hypothetical protein